MKVHDTLRFLAIWLVIGAGAILYAEPEPDKPAPMFTEKLQLDWDLIKKWKIVNRQRNENMLQYTLTPDPNVVNYHRYVTIVQTKNSLYTPFDEYIATLKEQKNPFEINLATGDFTGSQPKALLILSDRRQTQITGMIKGKESFIVFSYTDLTVRPTEELKNTWVARWQKARMVEDAGDVK